MNSHSPRAISHYSTSADRLSGRGHLFFRRGARWISIKYVVREKTIWYGADIHDYPQKPSYPVVLRMRRTAARRFGDCPVRLNLPLTCFTQRKRNLITNSPIFLSLAETYGTQAIPGLSTARPSGMGQGVCSWVFANGHGFTAIVFATKFPIIFYATASRNVECSAIRQAWNKFRHHHYFQTVSRKLFTGSPRRFRLDARGLETLYLISTKE